MTTEPLSEVQKARADLTAALDAIEYKLNLPKQAAHAVKRAGARARAFRKANPAAALGVVVVAAALVGGAVWLVLRAARK